MPSSAVEFRRAKVLKRHEKEIQRRKKAQVDLEKKIERLQEELKHARKRPRAEHAEV